MMRISRVRLVNFHNFVDETIEIAGGGHLFLLGDNGSGKTTVLDAVHYALAGGRLELNSAARLGGNRSEGRTIQGIALRLDFERGVRNEGGAIAYAAVELAEMDGERRLVVGVGTEATTLDARVSRWGFVTRRPLEEIPLVVEGGEERFPATREGLRAALGASQVFFRIGDYRAAVAARLFVGPAAYDDVCRFWSMAKAYREIVSGARNFEALFRRLLPAPDPAVFGEIARSLRSVADLEVALRELEGQQGYVAGLIAVSEEVTAQREVASRCRWLATHRRLEETRAQIEASRKTSQRLEEERERLGREVAAAEARAGRADDAVRAAEAEDPDRLGEALRAAEARAAELAGELAGREREWAERQQAAGEAEREASGTARALEAKRVAARAALAGAIDAVSEVPGDLPRARRLAGAMESGGPSAWTEVGAEAAAEASRLADTAARRGREGEAALERARAGEERCADELAALRRMREEQPRVDRYAAARRALACAGVEARPIYELLEPVANAAEERLAWVEALAGDAQLAALVVEPSERDRAAAIVAGAAPGVRVVVDTAAGARLPAWAEALFGGGGGDGGGDAAVATARAALAAAVAQPEEFGPIAAAEEGVLAHRGTRFCPHGARPRLFGRAARERAHRARVAAAEARLGDAASAVEAARTRADEAARRLGAVQALARAVAGAASAELARAEAEASAWRRAAASARELAERAGQAARDAGERERAARSETEALGARAEAVHLPEIEERIAVLRRAAHNARDSRDALQRRSGSVESDLRRQRERRQTLEDNERLLSAELARLADELRARVAALAGAGDDAVARYVRVEQRGDAFRSIENIEERLRAAERREAEAAFELAGDGSRGVRNIQFAPRFAASRAICRRRWRRSSG